MINRTANSRWVGTAVLLRFCTCRGGMSMVEFSLIAPVLILLFLGAVDIGNILIADRKVTAATSAVADLVAQDQVITDQELADIFSASSLLMVPFNPAELRIVVSSLETDLSGQTRVAWSESFNGTARNAGSAFNLPQGIAIPGESVILSEVSYLYTGSLGVVVTGNVSLTDQFYMRPRRALQVIRER